jgi:hypothetical protein
MQQSTTNSRAYLPHLLIIAGFIIISCLFCYPAFKGNTINQGDAYTWLYASRESRNYYDSTGKNALWANNMFSGMPQVLVDIQAETNWYEKLNYIFQLYTPGQPSNPAIYFFLAMIGFYILMCVMKVNKWLGAIGAIAFAFSSYNPIIITAGHTTKMLDIAYLPAIIGGVLLAYRGRFWSGAALAGLFLGVYIDSAHYQIIYYGAILILVIVAAQLVAAFRKKQLKNWLYASCTLALAAIFALGANASRLIQVLEYNPHSIRGGKSELTSDLHQKSGGLDRDYAFQWSNGIGETFCLLVPDLYGGSSGEDIGPDSHFGEKLTSLNVPQQYVEQMTSHAPMYWGPQPFISGPVYFGAVICLLALLAFFVIKSPFKWWLGGAALFFILLSMGKNFSTFNYFLFDHLPMLNKFRTPSMALSMPSIIFPILAIWALKDIFQEKISREELLKKIKISVFIIGGLCIIIMLGSQMFMDFKGASDAQLAAQYGQMFKNPQIGRELLDSLHADRSSAALGDAFRSLVFVLLAGGALWAFAKGKVKKEMAIAGMALLVICDEVPVAHRYLNKSNFLDDYTYQQQFQPRPVDAQIMKDTTMYYRVFDLTGSPFNDSKPSYFHNSIGGYSAAKLEIYQELIEHQLSKYNAAVLNMLNTKYIIVPGPQGNPVAQQNPDALGNAWFVQKVKWAKDADEAMKDLNAPSLSNPADSSMGNFKPLTTAVLRDSLQDEFKGFNFGKDSSAYIRLTQYGANRLTYESNNSLPGLGVFSEIYYPLGWTATIDGKPAHIFRTDYVLRALQIPAGKHIITFSFNPPSFKKGERVGLYGSILLTLLILAGIYMAFRKKEVTEDREMI